MKKLELKKLKISSLNTDGLVSVNGGRLAACSQGDGTPCIPEAPDPKNYTKWVNFPECNVTGWPCH